jgi:myo-inositol-hexaphosphate 3-phosphohydrolase
MEKASVRFSIYLIAEGLQAYRDSTGTLPATLREADLDEEGIEYVTNGSTYRLVALDGSNSIVYVEGDSPKRYGTAFNVLEGGAVR